MSEILQNYTVVTCTPKKGKSLKEIDCFAVI